MGSKHLQVGQSTLSSSNEKLSQKPFIFEVEVTYMTIDRDDFLKGENQKHNFC